MSAQRSSSYVAGMLSTARELSWLFAPTVNSFKRYQPGSWAPTAVAWGTDNRTCGLRLVGHGPGRCGWRPASRAPTPTRTSRSPASSRAGCMASRRRACTLEAPFVGNAYESKEVPRIPWNIVESIDLLKGSAVAKKAFGDDVVYHHFVTTAKHEWIAVQQGRHGLGAAPQLRALVICRLACSSVRGACRHGLARMCVDART